MQVCTSLQIDNHASTPPLGFFTGRMPFLPPNQQRQSTEGIILAVILKVFYMHLVTVCVHFFAILSLPHSWYYCMETQFLFDQPSFLELFYIGFYSKGSFFTSWMLFLSYLK